jgi:hypothetical protein
MFTAYPKDAKIDALMLKQDKIRIRADTAATNYSR